MLINLVTNTTNEAGLQRDAELLRDRLKQIGHDCQLIHFKDQRTWKQADLNLFLEIIEKDIFPLAPKQWFIPNPEWFFAHLWKDDIKMMSKVLVKTKHAHTLMQPYCRSKVIGFESADMYDPSIQRKRIFLHCAGKSINKNTEVIIKAWEAHKLDYPLIIVSRKQQPLRHLKSVQFIHRASEEDLRRMVNECVFHLCMSKYEGWGHNLHESMGCAGIVISHDQPPLKELHAELRVPARRVKKQQIAPMYEPTPADIAKAAHRAMSYTDDQLVKAGLRARNAYLNEVTEFRKRLAQEFA